MIGLAQSVTDDWDTLEPDFTRFYGADLRQLCWGVSPWGCRRLRSHITNLPPDSATVRKRVGTPMGWDNTTEQVAAVVDSLELLTRLYINAHSDSGDTSPVARVPRPYESPTVPETFSLAQFANVVKE